MASAYDYVSQSHDSGLDPNSTMSHTEMGLINLLSGSIDYERSLETLGFQNAFNAEEAQKSRDFTERMSNTAYQRAVSDMKAAGINPALAFSQGGAAVGSSASAHSGSGGSSHAGGMGSIVGGIVKLLGLGMTSAFSMAREQTKAMADLDARQDYYDLQRELAQIRANTAIDVADINGGYRDAVESYRYSHGHKSYK